MEIVKKGGRYTEASVAKLRPSFKEAIDSARQHWSDTKEPDCFHDYVRAKDMFAVKPVSILFLCSHSAYLIMCVNIAMGL